MSVKIRQVEQTAILQVVLKANTPANSQVFTNIILEPGLGAVQQLQIPPNEAWVLEDLFVRDSPTVDVILTFRKNLTEDVMKTAPLSALLVTNPARPRISKQVYEGNSIMTIVAQNLAAVGASDVTVTAFLKIRRFIAS